MKSNNKGPTQTDDQAALIFDTARLKAGDVVLERSDGKESEIITAVDGGSFSHALLWLGGSDFIEATDGGSRVISFARVGIIDPGRWSVLRFVGAGNDSDSIAADAAMHARNLAHMPYNLSGALRSVTPAARQQATKLFCSELVAEAYQRAGASVSDGVAPERTTPRVIEQSAKFRKVEPLPVQPGVTPPGDRGDAYQATKMQRENQVVQAVYATLMAEHGTALTAQPGAGPIRNLYDILMLLAMGDFILMLPIADRAHELLSNAGYYGFLDDETKADVASRAANASREEVVSRIDTLKRHQQNYIAYSGIYAVRPWALWEAHKSLYFDLAAFFRHLVEAALPDQLREGDF